LDPVLPAGQEAVRLAASGAAFAAVALVTALLCVFSAVAAWASVPGRAGES